MNKIEYSTRKYDFASVVKSYIDEDDLSQIHSLISYEIFSREQDQSSIWHRDFYEKLRSDDTFIDMYKQFVEEVIKPRYNSDQLVYQKVPTFRAHLVDNVAVGEYHKSKYYRDEKWAEKIRELSYYLPLTDTNESNTIWAESEEDKGDFSPMLLKYGECMEWDGTNLMHGNKVNDSNQTRVSLDFRATPLHRFVEGDCSSINTNTPFKIGHYYEVI